MLELALRINVEAAHGGDRRACTFQMHLEEPENCQAGPTSQSDIDRFPRAGNP
jgi:hypothetical protein